MSSSLFPAHLCLLPCALSSKIPARLHLLHFTLFLGYTSFSSLLVTVAPLNFKLLSSLCPPILWDIPLSLSCSIMCRLLPLLPSGASLLKVTYNLRREKRNSGKKGGKEKLEGEEIFDLIRGIHVKKDCRISSSSSHLPWMPVFLVV